ncbi:hypothetical protein CSKR_106268, partial [Clonorchis sinensis]
MHPGSLRIPEQAHQRFRHCYFLSSTIIGRKIKGALKVITFTKHAKRFAKSGTYAMHNQKFGRLSGDSRCSFGCIPEFYYKLVHHVWPREGRYVCTLNQGKSSTAINRRHKYHLPHLAEDTAIRRLPSYLCKQLRMVSPAGLMLSWLLSMIKIRQGYSINSILAIKTPRHHAKCRHDRMHSVNVNTRTYTT